MGCALSSEPMCQQGFLRVSGSHAPATVLRRFTNWETLTQWRGLDRCFHHQLSECQKLPEDRDRAQCGHGHQSALTITSSPFRSTPDATLFIEALLWETIALVRRCKRSISRSLNMTASYNDGIFTPAISQAMGIDLRSSY